MRDIILPIFLLIGTGFIFDRIFKPDIVTLSKMNFYIFVPSLTFTKILSTGIRVDFLLKLILFIFFWFLITGTIGFLISLFPRFRSLRVLFISNSEFNNCGNYGFPLIMFAFGESYLSILAIFLVFQNLLTFTFGVLLFSLDTKTKLKSLSGILKIPVLYAVIFGLFFRATKIELIPSVMSFFNYLADGLIPVALITLGVQLSRSVKLTEILPVGFMSFLRLIIAPLIAFILFPLFNIDPVYKKFLIIITSLPAAVNTFLLAEEYNIKPDIASQTVFFSTILSIITIPLILLIK